VRLQGPDDVDGLRAALLRLVADGVDPESVDWDDGRPRQGGLFEAAGDDGLRPAVAEAAVATRRMSMPARWPAGFDALLRHAALHDAPDTRARLHRLALQLHADPRVWDDTLHPERLLLERRAREIRGEIHRMHAFVRFRPVREASDPSATERWIAWYEPAHPIVRAAAPFFQQRFAAMHWAILTPQGSVAWDRERLHHGPPARREDAPPADAGEALWLAYYRATFNPARANPRLMQRHIPTRYHAALPEMAVAAPLLRESAQRTWQMTAHAADTTRRLPRPRPVVTLAPASADIELTPELAGSATADAAMAPPADPATLAADKAEARARLKDLAAQAARCERCPVASCATQTVFGRGNPRAEVMLVGEQPGDHEDRAGRPFVGPAGQLLQRAIAALGWPREALYVTNAVKHFHHTLRGSRRIHKTPEQAALAACLDWLEAEVDTVDPPLIVALGQTAARALLGAADADGAVPRAGGLHRRADGRAVLVAWHPSALLRAGVGQGGAPVEDHPRWAAWLAQLAPAVAAFTDDATTGGASPTSPHTGPMTGESADDERPT
jgi:DNA polymerase